MFGVAEPKHFYRPDSLPNMTLSQHNESWPYSFVILITELQATQFPLQTQAIYIAFQMHE